ncbi:MAG: hypothetical protein WCK86_05730 [Planctomycetia bacterium]
MNFWSEGMSRQKLFHEYRIACSSSAPSEPLCWHRVRPASSTAQFSTKGQQWQIRLNQDVELSRNLGIPAESQKFIKDLQQRVRSFRHQIAVHGVKSRRVRLFCFLVLVISRGIQHSSPGEHLGIPGCTTAAHVAAISGLLLANLYRRVVFFPWRGCHTTGVLALILRQEPACFLSCEVAKAAGQNWNTCC